MTFTTRHHVTREARGDGFRMELQTLLNRHSAENGSNTPDFVLANFLCDCLRAFDLATDQREHYYGLKLRPGQPPEKLRGDV